LVADSGDQIVGYAHFGAVAGIGDWELRRLYVARDFQNQGTGSRLMHAALAHPGMQAAEHITLDVWEHNPRARRFYERFGFVVVGERRFTVESGAETSLDLVMVRPRR
jgi:diamine N-acetyltransferase